MRVPSCRVSSSGAGPPSGSPRHHAAYRVSAAQRHSEHERQQHRAPLQQTRRGSSPFALLSGEPAPPDARRRAVALHLWWWWHTRRCKTGRRGCQYAGGRDKTAVLVAATRASGRRRKPQISEDGASLHSPFLHVGLPARRKRRHANRREVRVRHRISCSACASRHAAHVPSKSFP